MKIIFKLKTKLLTTFLIVSLVPLTLLTFIAVQKAGTALKEEAIAKLEAIQEAKKNHIRDAIRQVRVSVHVIKNDPYLQKSMTSFNSAFEQNGNTVDNDNWRTMVEFKEKPIKAMVALNGFYDLLMVSQAGNIVYTALKGTELGMNIPGSDLAGSSLGKAFESVKTAGDDAVVYADFDAYTVAGGVQAAFCRNR